MIENTDTDEGFKKFLRMTLAGNLTALRVRSTADTEQDDITQYIMMLEKSGVSFQYVAQCIVLAREIVSLLKYNTLVLTALLFHRIAYTPKDKKSFRLSCETVLEFYSSETISVRLMSYMKATQTEKISAKRFNDDRDYIVDIAHHVYGLPWDEFRSAWAYLLVEFQKAGRSPKSFKRYSKRRLSTLLNLSNAYGIYRTTYFRKKYEEQAVDNINRMLRAEL